MPLTRHLYREDEVRAALMWSITKRRRLEAAFWATELEESGCEFDAELVKVWTYGIGAAGLGFLGKLDGSVTTAIALACYGSRDASVIAVLGSKPSATGSPAIPTGSWTSEEACALRAMIQGRAGTAFGLSEAWPWSLWHTAMQFKHGRTFPIEDSLEAKALAVAIVCQPKLDVKEPNFEIPIEVASAMEAWSDLGLRARRVYAIPVECLSHLTNRGRNDSHTSTDAEIRDLRRLERGLEKSPLWSEAIVTARTSDAEYEDFYDSYFEDIPDEWSLADREKSHGRGTVPCDLKRFLNRWFGSMPCVIWKGIAKAELEGTGFDLRGTSATVPLAPVKRLIRSPQSGQ